MFLCSYPGAADGVNGPGAHRWRTLRIGEQSLDETACSRQKSAESVVGSDHGGSGRLETVYVSRCTQMPEPAPTTADLGRAVRRLRRGRGWTIDDLAARSGLHPTYLSRIERARSNATWAKVCQLADALGVAPSDIARAAEQERTDTRADAGADAGPARPQPDGP